MREYISLREYSTFKTGGNARFFVSATSIDVVREAVAFANSKSLPWILLSGGSNVLFDDKGFDGLVIHIQIKGIHLEQGVGDTVLLHAGAAEEWDSLVVYAVDHDLWGLENLSGIPGYVGASLVQNIGAYGAEVKDVFMCAHVLDTKLNEVRTVTIKDADFGYRHSMFQHNEHLVITHVTFKLSTVGTPQLSYKDLAQSVLTAQSSAREVRDTVLTIRANKFPPLTIYGTAGSFFKNPHITHEAYAHLRERYPLIPGYIEGDLVKVPLAWILDNVLNLKGYKQGHASLYERQPLVMVADVGATTHEVLTLADDIIKKVFDVTAITITPEVTIITTSHKKKF